MNKKKILEALYSRFQSGGHSEIMLAEAGQTGLPFDLLVTIHRGFGLVEGIAQGEYYFDEDDRRGFSLFVSCLRLSENVPEKAVHPLCIEIGLINAELPVGAFSYDPIRGVLAYRYRIPLDERLSEDEMTEEADACIALSLSTAEKYAAQLQEIVGL